MKNNYSSLTLPELLIEHDKALKRLEDLKRPDSKIVEAKVKEIWGDKPQGLTDQQKKQLDNILSLL